MILEFSLDGESTPPLPVKPAEQAKLDRLMRRHLKLEDLQSLERLLLSRLKNRKAELQKLWEELNGHWGYEDGFYRFYHGSFKVYHVQTLTDKAVKFLGELLPERELSESFMAIIREGTGKEFDVAHNREWPKQTRPILEAFSHARYMVEMAVRYVELREPPQPMPSGWAGLLYLYDLR